MSLSYKGQDGYTFQAFKAAWMKDVFKENIANHCEKFGWEEDAEGGFVKQMKQYTFHITPPNSTTGDLLLEVIDIEKSTQFAIHFCVFHNNGYAVHIDECLSNLDKDVESGRFRTDYIYVSFTPNMQYEDIKRRMEYDAAGKEQEQPFG